MGKFFGGNFFTKDNDNWQVVWRNPFLQWQALFSRNLSSPDGSIFQKIQFLIQNPSVNFDFVAVSLLQANFCRFRLSLLWLVLLQASQGNSPILFVQIGMLMFIILLYLASIVVRVEIKVTWMLLMYLV